jgi:hypothetical protein
MGILLARNENRENELFSHYDSEKTGKLSEDDIELMLIDIFLICATLLP